MSTNDRFSNQDSCFCCQNSDQIHTNTYNIIYFFIHQGHTVLWSPMLGQLTYEELQEGGGNAEDTPRRGTDTPPAKNLESQFKPDLLDGTAAEETQFIENYFAEQECESNASKTLGVSSSENCFAEQDRESNASKPRGVSSSAALHKLVTSSSRAVELTTSQFLALGQESCDGGTDLDSGDANDLLSLLEMPTGDLETNTSEETQFREDPPPKDKAACNHEGYEVELPVVVDLCTAETQLGDFPWKEVEATVEPQVETVNLEETQWDVSDPPVDHNRQSSPPKNLLHGSNNKSPCEILAAESNVHLEMNGYGPNTLFECDDWPFDIIDTIAREGVPEHLAPTVKACPAILLVCKPLQNLVANLKKWRGRSRYSGYLGDRIGMIFIWQALEHRGIEMGEMHELLTGCEKRPILRKMMSQCPPGNYRPGCLFKSLESLVSEEHLELAYALPPPAANQPEEALSYVRTLDSVFSAPGNFDAHSRAPCVMHLQLCPIEPVTIPDTIEEFIDGNVSSPTCLEWTLMNMKRKGVANMKHAVPYSIHKVEMQRYGLPVRFLECAQRTPVEIIKDGLPDNISVHATVHGPKRQGYSIFRDRLLAMTTDDNSVNFTGSMFEFEMWFGRRRVMMDPFMCYFRASPGEVDKEIQTLAVDNAVDQPEDGTALKWPDVMNAALNVRREAYVKNCAAKGEWHRRHFFADLEQTAGSHNRVSFDHLPSLLCSGQMWSEEAKRCMTAGEHLNAQGLPIYRNDGKFKVPFDISQLSNNLVKSMAGNGLHIPSFTAFQMYCLAHVGAFAV
jgi:hypothetical protein